MKRGVCKVVGTWAVIEGQGEREREEKSCGEGSGYVDSTWVDSWYGMINLFIVEVLKSTVAIYYYVNQTAEKFKLLKN